MISYLLCSVLLFTGLFYVIFSRNLAKKLISLSIFQSAIILFFMLIAKQNDALAPVYQAGEHRYANPLPHILMLTAIVVGIAVLSVGLSLLVKIKENYGTLDQEKLDNERE